MLTLVSYVQQTAASGTDDDGIGGYSACDPCLMHIKSYKTAPKRTNAVPKNTNVHQTITNLHQTCTNAHQRVFLCPVGEGVDCRAYVLSLARLIGAESLEIEHLYNLQKSYIIFTGFDGLMFLFVVEYRKRIFTIACEYGFRYRFRFRYRRGSAAKETENKNRNRKTKTRSKEKRTKKEKKSKRRKKKKRKKEKENLSQSQSLLLL